jgi:tRNA G18 (ribose-2'-O)-methylase SpoU
MPRIDITAAEDPRIEAYRELKGRTVWKQGASFIVEGTKTVARLLESDYELVSVLLIESRVADWLPRVPDHVPCYVVPQPLGAALVGFNFHVGVVACARRREFPRLAEVVAPRERPLTLVVCPKCDNPENLGAIIRIAAGFGVDAILLGPQCCDPFSRRVLRVSMGTALRMTFVESRRLESDLIALRDDWNVELAATMLDATATPLHAAHRSPRFALLLGNEDTGLDPELAALCQQRLTIPMAPGTDSLNVAVAAGICLHHFRDVAARAEPGPAM